MAKKDETLETETIPKLRTFTVRTPISHDLVRYEPGESIELTEEQAVVLSACGAIE